MNTHLNGKQAISDTDFAGKSCLDPHWQMPHNGISDWAWVAYKNTITTTGLGTEVENKAGNHA